jgi:plastocyanin
MDPFAILTARRNAAPQHQERLYLWPFIFLALILLGAAVILFGPTPPMNGQVLPTQTPEREARIYTVSYRFGVFSPTNLRIHVGDTVRFRNDSAQTVRIIADLELGRRIPEFDSGAPIDPEGSFSHTFASAGAFSYHNRDDESETGVIIVR